MFSVPKTFSAVLRKPKSLEGIQDDGCDLLIDRPYVWMAGGTTGDRIFDEHKKRVLNWMKSAHIFFPKTSYTHRRMDTWQNCSTKVEALVMFH